MKVISKWGRQNTLNYMKSIGIPKLSVEQMRNFRKKFSWNYTSYLCGRTCFQQSSFTVFKPGDLQTFSPHQLSSKFHITLQHRDHCT